MEEQFASSKEPSLEPSSMSTDSLVELSKRLSALEVSDASKEVKIQGLLQSIAEKDQSDEKLRAELQSIQEEVQRLQDELSVIKGAQRSCGEHHAEAQSQSELPESPAVAESDICLREPSTLMEPEQSVSAETPPVSPQNAFNYQEYYLVAIVESIPEKIWSRFRSSIHRLQEEQKTFRISAAFRNGDSRLVKSKAMLVYSSYTEIEGLIAREYSTSGIHINTDEHLLQIFRSRESRLSRRSFPRPRQ